MSKHNYTALTTFRGWSEEQEEWIYGTGTTDFLNISKLYPEYKYKGKLWLWSNYSWKRVHSDSIGVYTGTEDKDGKPIFCGVAGAKYGGDKLRFADKWEWYKHSYGMKMSFADDKERAELQKQYDAEPYEERYVDGLGDFEWLLSSEIQTYWGVVGNQWEEHLKAEQ
jgi:hypothetical protein